MELEPVIDHFFEATVRRELAFRVGPECWDQETWGKQGHFRVWIQSVELGISEEERLAKRASARGLAQNLFLGWEP